MKISKYFDSNCKMKDNGSTLSRRNNQNIVETAIRKPFSDKNNILNKLNFEPYDQYNGNNFLQSKIHTNKCHKPFAQVFSNLNLDWKVTCEDLTIISRKMGSKEHGYFSDNETWMPCVYIESECSKNINKHMANTSPVVNIKQVSGKNLQKYLKKCNVIVEDPSCNKSMTIPTKIDTHTNSLRKKPVSNITNNVSLKSYRRSSQVTVQSEGPVLRDRKQKVNYAKLHEGSFSGGETFTNTSLISKKKTDKKNKILDVFVFQSDSDEDEANKKDSLNKSVPFEKEMKLFMCKIEKQHEKQNKRKKKVNNCNIRKVQERVMEDFKIFQTKPINVSRTIKKNNILHRENMNVYMNSKKQNQLMVTNNDIHKGTRDKVNNKPVDMFVTNKVLEHGVNILQNITLLESTTPEKDLNKHVPLIQSANNLLDENNGNIGSSEKSINVNEKFNNINTRKRKPNQPDEQDALSDADIVDAIADDESSRDSLDFGNVNFNSTPLNNERNTGDSTPWRPNLYTKRNPHYLQYKSTALPSYNQDMVIDSSDVEKIYYDKMPSDSNQSKKNRQSSILSYINRKSRSVYPDIIESSLFDIHELSPIKSFCQLTTSKEKSIKSSENKENMSLKNISNKGFKNVKRQILGEKHDTSNNIPNNFAKSPEANRTLDSDEENSYFGFQNLSNNDQNENESQETRKKQNTWLFGKPLRLEDCIKITKKSKNVTINESIHEQNKKIKEKVVVEKENQFEEEVSNDNDGKNTHISESQTLPIGLFEDLEEPNKNVILKRYERKTRKRVRRRSINANEESDDEHHTKRNKNKRTKAEDAEADTWAKAFNKMCREVDKFPLEIE